MDDRGNLNAKILARGLLIVGLVCQTTCSDSNSLQAMYDNYLSRLQNVTGIEIEVRKTNPLLPVYPRHRDLVLPVEEIRIDFSDFFDLAECDLFQLVSERNSSLGRLQAPSQRLVYEIDFYGRITECRKDLTRSLTATRISDEFLRKVAEIEAAKARSLPVVFWNATFAGPEFEVLLTTRTRALRREEKVDTAAIVSSLDYLTRIGRGLDSASADLSAGQLESHYFTLQKEKVIGKLLRGLQVSRDNLARASEILERTAARNPLCPQGKKTTEADYLRNVFYKFYIGEVQPYLSAIHRPAEILLDAVNRLLEVQRIQPPEEFITYRRKMLGRLGSDSLWLQYHRQIDRHTRAWQTVLRQCQLMPGSETKADG